MNYAPKGDARDKRTRGHRNMRGRQDDDVVIVVVRSSPTSSVGSTYASRHPVELSSPVSLRIAESEYRTGCCSTTGMRPSSLFLARDAGPPPDAALDATMGTGYHT